jgi:hypothetical protein
LFAAHEAAVVPALVDLSPPDVTTAMRAWREAATPQPEPRPERPQVLHLSRTLADRWRTDGTLGPETGELLATALRLAQTPDDDGQPARTPATRRADALGDICRHFLDHQQTRRGGRHRPHLNLVIDLERHLTHPRAGATTPDGTRLDRPTVDRLLCDSALHRVLTAGRSTILDYGRATRTIPAPLFNALVIRDRHCRFPGCDRPTHWCQGHHIRFWDHGGPTQLANLVLVCSRHHHLLHRPGWHTKLLPDATLEITDPRGRHRTTSPPDRAPPSRTGPDPGRAPANVAATSTAARTPRRRGQSRPPRSTIASTSTAPSVAPAPREVEAIIDPQGRVGPQGLSLLDEYCVDSGRVFATGVSNGAGMSMTLGCELGDRFAAIAPVAGVNLSRACPRDDPVSVLAIHGDADAIASYGGNNLLGFQLDNPSVPDRMAAWAAYDGCEVGPTIDRSTPDLAVASWSRVRRRHRRRAVDLAGWSHGWPRATETGQPGVISHRRGARLLRRPRPV